MMFARPYGAHPLHLLAMVASFALAGYAAILLVEKRSIMVIVWFVGAAIVHDLVLLPLYAIADARLVRLRDRRRERSGMAPWINYVRVPAVLSGLLLLIFLPSIAGLSDTFTETTMLSSSGYFARWLAVTGVLFLLSGLALALRMRRIRKAEPETDADDASR